MQLRCSGPMDCMRLEWLPWQYPLPTYVAWWGQSHTFARLSEYTLNLLDHLLFRVRLWYLRPWLRRRGEWDWLDTRPSGEIDVLSSLPADSTLIHGKCVEVFGGNSRLGFGCSNLAHMAWKVLASNKNSWRAFIGSTVAVARPRQALRRSSTRYQCIQRN